MKRTQAGLKPRLYIAAALILVVPLVEASLQTRLSLELIRNGQVHRKRNGPHL